MRTLFATLFATALMASSAHAATEAFVWSTDTSGGTPHATYSHNPTGAENHVRRLGRGRYRVTFPGLASSGGNVQISAYDSAASRCKFQNWRHRGENLEVNVRCHRGTALVDTRFVALYTHGEGSGTGDFAYLWANRADRTHTSPRTFRSGGSHRIERLGAGQYNARLRGIRTVGGNVLVTAYGTDPSYCKVQGWGPSGSDTAVHVLCFDADGAPKDSRFSLRYERSEHDARDLTGYVWAGRPTTATYPAHATYQHNGNSDADNVVTRASTGRYTVNYPDLPPTGSTALVTAHGADASWCNVASWGGDASATSVSVRCFRSGGAAANSAFTQTYRVAARDFRTIVVDPDGSRPALGSWTGNLQLVDPATAGELVRIEYMLGDYRMRDGWFRVGDVLVKKVVDTRGRFVGTVSIDELGLFRSLLDLDGDGAADLMEVVTPAGIQRLSIAEGRAREIYQAWEAGRNPFCVGSAPRGIGLDDAQRGLMAGCAEMGDTGGMPERDGGFGTSGGPNDPMDMLCAGIDTTRPDFSTPVRRDDRPLYQIVADAWVDFIENGFDGERDHALVQLPRILVSTIPGGYAIWLSFLADSIINFPAGTGWAEMGSGIEDLQTGSNPTEHPGDPENGGPPAMLVSACEAREEPSRRERYVDALDPRCTDPAAADDDGIGEEHCIAPVELVEVDGLGEMIADLECDPSLGGECEPDDILSRLPTDFDRDFDFVPICNPLLCDPR
jgi:hypothetical protein